MGPGTEEEAEWRTDTAIDEFNSVYKSMSMATKRHRGFAPHEVDLMLVSTCAVIMGAGIDVEARERAQLAELGRRRAAGEDVGWHDLDG